MAPSSTVASSRARVDQPSFDDLEASLRDTTFVVVDLETTGGSSRTEAITEIGAVKVRGGEVLGEFATLVHPARPIPAQITLLTGISDAMVREAPSEAAVIPLFLEFARGSVLVAHNAPFDIGFLKAACLRLGMAWPAATVVDTVRLARAVFTRAELPSVRLGILASVLGARTDPTHRALDDARATVDVLHALIERLGSGDALGVSDLVTAGRAVDPRRRRKRHLADGIPSAPGVYLFRAADDAVLYVGTSGDLHRRVRSYFTAAEQRGRMNDMVLAADHVDYVVCATRLEAAVREQRLIVARQPPYNKRSKRRERPYWLTIGEPPASRLTLHPRDPGPGECAVGPFSSRAIGREAVDAWRAAHAAPLLRDGRVGDAIQLAHDDMERAALGGRFAQAAEARDRLAAVIRDLARSERITALVAIGEIVTATPDGSGGWEIAVVRRGRLVAAGLAPRGTPPMPVVESLVHAAETVVDGQSVIATAEETATILAYLEVPGTRIVRSSAGWSSPVAGAGRWREFAERAAAARESAVSGPH